MNKFVLSAALAVGLLLVGLVGGCGKKATEEAANTEAPTAAPAAPATVSQADEVRAALKKKDYDTAIAGIVKARQAASNTEQMNAVANLIDEVKIQLLENAPNEPKAEEALVALRQITGGR